MKNIVISYIEFNVTCIKKGGIPPVCGVYIGQNVESYYANMWSPKRKDFILENVNELQSIAAASSKW